MLVIYPFSVPDQEQALKNAQWIAEIGNYESHHLFILADKRCDQETARKINQLLVPLFKLVQFRWTKADIDGWPEGANHMFTYSTALIQHEKLWPYFLWLEPDAIPIRTGWLDELEAEYKRAGKPFMGEKVDLGEKRPDVPIHMSGVGIYQNPIYLLAGEAYRAHETAWDIAAKDQIIPHCHFTKMIQHYWKHGTFTSLDGLRPETLIFHSSKDGSLIDLLRQKSSGGLTAVQPLAVEARPIADAARSIKILPLSGIWVLDGDTIISDMVEREGRLDFDTLIPHILPLIRPGDTVVDVGAFIGDHTVAYSHAVGKAGKVIAYEPNHLAFQCLVHNTEGMSNVFGFCHALGAQREEVELTDLPNAASNYIGAGRQIRVRPFDEDASLFGQIDLIKIDVEGYELNVLKGAEQLINKFHPKMVVEINEIALTRQNTTPTEVINWIVARGYAVSILHRHKDAPFYDILAVANQPPEIPQADIAHTQPASPVVPFNYGEMILAIQNMKVFASQSISNRLKVMQNLRHAGLTPAKPNKKKQHGNNPFAKTANRKRKQSAEEHPA